MKKSIPSTAREQLHICTVTPCYERPDLVQTLLDSLYEARLEDEDTQTKIDFIIVDSTAQGSKSQIQISSNCKKVGAYYLRGPDSVREKRNLGAQKAHELGANIVLFIDSDCQAQPRLFQEHRNAYQIAQSPFTNRPVGGVIGVTRFVGTDTPAYRAAVLTPFLDSFSFAERMPEAPWAPCTNFSVLLDVFEQVGGFPEHRKYRLGGDDTEFGRRVNNAGYAILSRPQAVVLHSKSTWSRWSDILERVWRWGKMDISVRQAEPAANRQWIGPQPLPVALLLFPAAILWGLLPFLMLLLSTIFGAPIATAFLRSPQLKKLPDYVGAEFLLFIFKLGSLFEAIRSGWPHLGYQEIVTHPMQIGTSWDTRRRDAWVSILILGVFTVTTLVLQTRVKRVK